MSKLMNGSQDDAVRQLEKLILGLKMEDAGVPVLGGTVDDRSNYRPGYSFLGEQKNAGWVEACRSKLSMVMETDPSQVAN